MIRLFIISLSFLGVGLWVAPVLAGVVIPGDLSRLQAADVRTHFRVSENKIKSLRLNTMIEAAETLGVQSGVKWRYDQILVRLEELSESLDKLNFEHLLLNRGKVLPAVIEEANDVKTIISDVHMSQSLTTYHIRAPARIVSAAPSWRDYLSENVIVEGIINDALLPKTQAEHLVWRKSVTRSWEVGVRQAEFMLITNLARLKRDYLGMVRFHILAKQGVISTPILAEGRLGLNVAGRSIDIDQRIFKITGGANFNNDGRIWKAITGSAKP